MKTIIINASPRKNWNTAQLLKEAQKGAESVGGEVEYIDLYDLTFIGCRSCMACFYRRSTVSLMQMLLLSEHRSTGVSLLPSSGD